MYSLCAAVEEDNRKCPVGDTTDKNSFYKISHRKAL